MKKIIYFFLFISLLILSRVFIVAVYTVNQDSMNNTYNSGDHVLLLKNFYNINRNDILIFDHDNENLIKRCIGLPGDSIKIVKGEIFVNNQLVKNPQRAIVNSNYKNDIFTESLIYNSYGSNWNPTDFDYFLIPKRGTKIIFNHINKSLYENLIKLDNSELSIQNQSYYIFKNDYYFLIGDNRGASIDSRFFGPIKLSNITGKVIFPMN